MSLLATALSKFAGQVVLIKIGGSVLEDANLASKFASDVLVLIKEGILPILVHGGGPAINVQIKESGSEPEFKFGLRVTDSATLQIVEKVLGDINESLVEQLQSVGVKAQGFAPNTTVVFQVEKKKFVDVGGEQFELGFVGEVLSCNSIALNELIHEHQVPVIAPIGVDNSGQFFNINADDAALALCSALGVSVLINVTNTPGLLADSSDAASKIEKISAKEAQEMLAGSSISGGMIPKVQSCLKAIEAGVKSVHIVDGRISGALLKAFETPGLVGTTLISE